MRSAYSRLSSTVGLVVGLLAFALVLVGCDSNGGGGNDDMPDETSTITELAAGQDNLSTLVGALETAELDDDLADEDQTFTVFAPVNSAFENIDADELTGNSELLSEVLTYHVVPGQAIASGDIQDGQTVTTLEGDTLRFSVDGNSVQVNGASVTTADLQASNGVVHVIDEVMLETVDAVDRAVLTPQLSTTAAAIQAAELAEDDSPLRDQKLTLFAPVDGSFANLELNTLTSETELLARILQYHVVPGTRIASGQISGGETPGTLEGGTLNIAVDNGTVTVNGIPVTTTDIETENATIHLIDGVLLQRIDVVERASITKGLGTLADAVETAGLGSALKGDGPFTIFAPVDSAFADYNLDVLTNDTDLLGRVLKYHAISGQAITSGQLSSGESPQTLEGGTITIDLSGNGVTLNGAATVTVTDIQVRNGVIHLIDDVLLQRTNAVERASVTPAFSILTDLVGQAGLANALSGPGPDGEDGITVFAPTNDAFLAALDDNDNGEVDDSEVPSNAENLLKYHVVDDVFFASDVPTSETPLPTLEGSDVTVVRDGNAVTLNPNAEASSVIAPNVDVSNGVIHGLDRILSIPSSSN